MRCIMSLQTVCYEKNIRYVDNVGAHKVQGLMGLNWICIVQTKNSHGSHMNKNVRFGALFPAGGT